MSVVNTLLDRLRVQHTRGQLAQWPEEPRLGMRTRSSRVTVPFCGDRSQPVPLRDGGDASDGHLHAHAIAVAARNARRERLLLVVADEGLRVKDAFIEHLPSDRRNVGKPSPASGHRDEVEQRHLGMANTTVPNSSLLD